jgi:ABC-type antimicrobial peptide transport system permease subunit
MGWTPISLEPLLRRGNRRVIKILSGFLLMLAFIGYLLFVGRHRPLTTLDLVIAILFYLIPGLLLFYHGYKSQNGQ